MFNPFMAALSPAAQALQQALDGTLPPSSPFRRIVLPDGTVTVGRKAPLTSRGARQAHQPARSAASREQRYQALKREMSRPLTREQRHRAWERELGPPAGSWVPSLENRLRLKR